MRHDDIRGNDILRRIGVKVDESAVLHPGQFLHTRLKIAEHAFMPNNLMPIQRHQQRRPQLLADEVAKRRRGGLELAPTLAVELCDLALVYGGPLAGAGGGDLVEDPS